MQSHFASYYLLSMMFMSIVFWKCSQTSMLWVLHISLSIKGNEKYLCFESEKLLLKLSNESYEYWYKIIWWLKDSGIYAFYIIWFLKMGS